MVKCKIKQTKTGTRKYAHTQKKQNQNQIKHKAREQPGKQKYPKIKSVRIKTNKNSRLQ